jgi:hypothetical protein
MADPVVDFVSDWIADDVTPEVTGGDVDADTLQEHLSRLIAEAQDEGITEEDIDDTGLDVPGLIEAALTGSADADDGDDE